jgi:excisionase family DNA binding protein
MSGSGRHTGSMNVIPPYEPLLDVKAVARILGLHPGTVMRLARAGRFPAFRYSRHWRFRKEDVSRWIEKQAFVARPQKPHPADNVALESGLV